ncbi:hypothetical protein PQR66_37925 [Paraburkholderia agricolaris]|uniref:Beta/Gamma crystallin n=1 Tax=Paraburkholderia agricolaris TaxID=2152888 RepID=A0ABW9A2R4_9BURK
MTKHLLADFISILTFCFGALDAYAQTSNSGLPMDRVDQGRIQLPDFAGRDHQYSTFRTRITNEMKTGPNFAGHYAMIEIGCGTGCRFVYIGDVATGKVSQLPLGGEEYDMLNLSYGVKSNYISARWMSGDDCYRENLEWTGTQFLSSGKDRFSTRSECQKF